MRVVRRFAAVTALAVITAGVSATAASADERVHTALDISVHDHSIAPGESDVVHGWLHTFSHHPRGLADKKVTLFDRPAGATDWSKVATHRTTRRGFTRFDVQPATTTDYRLVFAGTQRFAASHSPVDRVFVGQPTNLTIAVGSSSINPGESDTVSGVLTSNGEPLAGQPVALLARTNHQSRLHVIGSGTTGTDGSVSFNVSPTQTTHYRLLFRRTSTYQRAFSDAAIVYVRIPTSLSIRALKDTIASGQSDQISGTLLAPHRPLPGRTVSLLARAAGTTDAFVAVATAKTNKKGYVAFTVTPTASEDYQLSFGPGPRYQSCHSGVVTVTVR